MPENKGVHSIRDSELPSFRARFLKNTLENFIRKRAGNVAPLYNIGQKFWTRFHYTIVHEYVRIREPYTRSNYHDHIGQTWNKFNNSIIHYINKS